MPDTAWLDVDNLTYNLYTAQRAVEAINDCAPELINDITHLQALLTVTAVYLVDTRTELHDLALRMKGEAGLAIITKED
jgi:conjugal transfer/entry exclusion protein